MRYRESEVTRFFKHVNQSSDLARVTILREPATLFESTFAYYTLQNEKTTRKILESRLGVLTGF